MAKVSRWISATLNLTILAGAAAIGAATAIYGQPLIHDNTEATGIIVTVFSILAGFLIAIMTLLGEDSVVPGSWRIAKDQRVLIRAKLIRQKWLFYIYLGTLILIFIASLLKKSQPDVTVWLEHIYLGLATFAFALSFRLPSTLMAVQTERIDAVIQARRNSASTLDRN